MSTTTLLVLLLLTITGLLVVAAPAYLVWRHPSLRAPLGIAVGAATVFATVVFGIAMLKS
ncbi:hypothetical protein ACIO8G_34675 [Streptomyces sp. NPDC087219]|uniref:hypothetical protein n=1 Tax=Streptomyces sp. NPDC087219 TaxID=3365770 RepID=UPI0037F6533E